MGAGAEGRGGLALGGETDLRGLLTCVPEGGVVEKRTGEGPALELKLALLKLRLRLPSSAERGRSGDLRREREDILPPV